MHKISLVLDYDKNLDHYLRRQYPELQRYQVLSESLDLRGAQKGKRPKKHYKLQLFFEADHEESSGQNFPQKKQSFSQRPIIIGAGPAGLFCALRLEEYGIKTTLIERGQKANERMKKIARFWRYGQLDENSNVCFGEGGAGLFSDGKLITRIKSPYISYVMDRLVDFGADPSIKYMANPHLGSEKIRKLITQITDFLIERGHHILFEKKVEKILSQNKTVTGVECSNGEKFLSDHVIMASGHSAKELYYHLFDLGVAMEAKSFAVGVRAEHPRRYINQIQFGPFDGDPLLGQARYRLSYENKQTQKGTYSFCMCPGGYVLSSGTDKKGLVVNGMSNSGLNSPWSNAAIVVSVSPAKDLDIQKNGVLAGVVFQENIEQKAMLLSQNLAQGKELPAMLMEEFLNNPLKVSQTIIKHSSPSGIIKVPFAEIFPQFILNHLHHALLRFDQKMKGFINSQAILMAPETRTSAPVSILRDKEKLCSLTHSGLYPCGEGAGYAGGITSAAVDGIKVAEAIVKKD